jgi:hypothetical protein
MARLLRELHIIAAIGRNEERSLNGLFAGEPRIPLDTGGVGRALRGVAVVRKNHYGSRSERGTRVAALFYSLIESAKLAGWSRGRISVRRLGGRSAILVAWHGTAG